MDQPIYNYDEVSDKLYISFAPGEQATGIELTPHILLRLNKQDRRAIGMTFLEYSLLAQKTDLGPRSFPLTGLSELPDDLQDIVIDVLQRPRLATCFCYHLIHHQFRKRFRLCFCKLLTN